LQRIWSRIEAELQWPVAPILGDTLYSFRRAILHRLYIYIYVAFRNGGLVHPNALHPYAVVGWWWGGGGPVVGWWWHRSVRGFEGITKPSRSKLAGLRLGFNGVDNIDAAILPRRPGGNEGNHSFTP
jgi:hypothetical protein